MHARRNASQVTELRFAFFEKDVIIVENRVYIFGRI
jgi:hypothetical protein